MYTLRPDIFTLNVNFYSFRWSDITFDRRVARVKLARAAAKMRQRTVAASMGTWMDHCDARIRARYIAGKVFGHMVAGKVSNAWATWIIFVRYMHTDAIEAQRQHIVVKRCLARIHNRQLDAAFAGWIDVVETHKAAQAEKTRQAAVVERCVRRMKQMTHVRMFGRWYEAVQEIKAIRHLNIE